MKKALLIIVPVLVCFAVGFLSSIVQEESIRTWYVGLNKAPLTPPNMVFPVVWGILYTLMGISVGLILNRFFVSATAKLAVGLFAAQLVFNVLWSVTFFYLKNPVSALIVILILEALLCCYAFFSYKIQKASSYLFIPYILWVAFATYLNIYVLMYN